MKTQVFEYTDQETVLEGFYAYDEKQGSPDKKPLVLVSHDWSGCNDFAKEKAKKLADLGYVGFALDMYGKGKRGVTKEEKSALIQPFMAERRLLLQRIQAAFTAAQKLPMVDSQKVAAIGFCFGGLCVLDLARSGAALKGVVSFHGLLNAPDSLRQTAIQAKVLVLHGYDDPMATPAAVNTFAKEMTEAKADWQIDIYGHTLHAFTNPEANDPAFGTVYSAQADHRSWQAMKNFFEEIF
jgi:dienelactone hydrolase